MLFQPDELNDFGISKCVFESIKNYTDRVAGGKNFHVTENQECLNTSFSKINQHIKLRFW